MVGATTGEGPPDLPLATAAARWAAVQGSVHAGFIYVFRDICTVRALREPWNSSRHAQKITTLLSTTHDVLALLHDDSACTCLPT